MGRVLSQSEEDIFKVEFPQYADKFNIPGTQREALYNDGWVVPSAALGFPVLVYIKRDDVGTIIYVNVSEEFPGGVRAPLPAPIGFLDEMLARMGQLYTYALWGIGLFALYMVWDITKRK